MTRTHSLVLAASLVLTFIAGCVAKPFLVPPATANQASLTRWDYVCFADHDVDRVAEKSKALGAEGWEMVTGNAIGWCFKRAL